MHAFDRLLDGLPHITCLARDPILVWVSVVADAAIMISYFAIPAVLAWQAWRGGDGGLMPSRWITSLFCAFIVLCGLTHLMSIVTTWIPIWQISKRGEGRDGVRFARHGGDADCHGTTVQRVARGAPRAR